MPKDPQQLASLFEEAAALLDFKGESPFKVRAYKAAARQIEALGKQSFTLNKSELMALPGIGEALSEKILIAREEGSFPLRDRLLSEVGAAAALAAVPGIGPRTAGLLFRELGVADLDGLLAAGASGRLVALTGFGPKKSNRLMDAAQRFKKVGHLLWLPDALGLSRALSAQLEGEFGPLNLRPTGALRRAAESCERIELLGVLPQGKSPEGLLSQLDELPPGYFAGQISLAGQKLHLTLVPPHLEGMLLLLTTGSVAHLEKLKQRLEAPLDPREDRWYGKGEQDIYQAAGLAFIPPELREDLGEFSPLPADLLTRQAILGDLHAHTDASDGTLSLEEMARAAKARGHSYLAICDHSPSLKIAHGQSIDDLMRQGEAISALNEILSPFTLLWGAEVDILPDGRLDLPDGVLEKLDVVVASIHQQLRLDEAAQTRRLIAAIEHPQVTLIGHPTGRMLGRRDGYAIDHEAVFEAAARCGCALEMSASPRRLDLPFPLARLALRRGVRLAINTDAHSDAELDFLPLGVMQARKAWATPKDILNTQTKEQWLASRMR